MSWDHIERWQDALVLRNDYRAMMIPGGGLEVDEDERDCCAREVEEETGILIQPSECVLEIDEYYEDWKWVNRYFLGEIVGSSEVKLTEREKEAGMASY